MILDIKGTNGILDILNLFKNLERNVTGGITNINAYAFSTPSDYVIELANKLQKMAIDNGYTTDLVSESIDGTSVVDYLFRRL